MASHHSELEGEYQLFIDEFLQSPSLRLYDKWKTNGDLGLRKSQRRKLTDLCLKVLLELFTGFSANQYESADRLYLTMRRKDKNIVQPTQLVICSLNFRDFDLTYNVELSLPVLSYQKNKANLDIPMPLFDYILSRSKGKIGSALTPIHQSKIDWFHGELLKAYRAENGDNNDDEVTVIKSGISGEITLHNFIYDADKHVLEVEK
ncbi:hypothetical protein GCM10007895_23050 [Paraferrimonas sedimenticola]|uniref:Uncharacterized protein n=2 Tax=Paraferrimonas sedimenticola TaxID=375674 RepID=A0AA37VZ32_9GAMM|nr:hypothetical protein GCM10007895_23050 [Paraferrimonas sedimenticola]